MKRTTNLTEQTLIETEGNVLATLQSPLSGGTARAPKIESNSGRHAGTHVRVLGLSSALIVLALLFAGMGMGRASGVAASSPTYSGPDKAAKASAPNPAGAYRFPAYFIEWGVYTRDYVPADVPADQLTQINYSFINPVPVQGTNYFQCSYYDNYAAVEKPMQRLVPGTNSNLGENLGAINQLKVLRRVHPGLQLLMSIGGYTLSSNFSSIASTADNRTHFVDSCVAFMQSKGFDGIDIDWEYPAAADRDNFTALLQAFRTKLTQVAGASAPLSIAAPPAATEISHINIPAISSILSWVNVMTYDFGGGFDNVSSHESPLCSATGDPHGSLWNASGAIQQWLSGGMPASKIDLGMAYYGRAVQHLGNTGPDAVYPGRFAPITPNDFVRGTWDDPAQPQSTWTGVFDYFDIIDHYTGPFQASFQPLTGLNGYTRYWDNQQQVPFVFRPDAVGPNGTGVWMSYDDPQSLVNKVNYARTMGLGGVFAWELSQESHPAAAEHPLTTAIYNALTGPLTQYQCSVPASPTPMGATATRTTVAATSTSTTVPATATRTTVPATATSTSTTAPTQTPGGASATPVPPSSTSTTVPPSSTSTPMPPTQTPGGASATPMQATSTPTACSMQFTDVPTTNTFWSYVRCLACRGIVTGYTCGGANPVTGEVEPCDQNNNPYFRYNNPITRGQISKLVSNAAGFSEDPGSQLLEDVPSGSPFFAYVNRLVNRGVMGGYACGGTGEPCVAPFNRGYFRPSSNASRGQLSKIVSNAAGFSEPSSQQTFEDVPAASTFY
ncbi:MAG: glycosyl hydrolase family 18 protein, partial [Chloroflexota bacterium]|nr:glycosyl hydrolase family 18 protein [Chloroflexota bacterium]